MKQSLATFALALTVVPSATALLVEVVDAASHFAVQSAALEVQVDVEPDWVQSEWVESPAWAHGDQDELVSVATDLPQGHRREA